VDGNKRTGEVMREEIRLGNEALARNDLDTATQCFHQLLAAGGTPVQERIAVNRLREIEELRAQEEALRNPPPVKPRTRRKTTGSTKREEVLEHRFVRPPDEPLVVIKRH
jgi:hypothetical protein